MPSRSGARLAARLEARALLPSPLPYPEDLPITGRKQDILAALAGDQVVIVAGETGSGKSTQLPKICIEAGRGSAGMIGHTQPRRIAARSIAERVAEELGATLGGPVGYKVRFTDRVGEGTLVKVMTDGVLLAELHSDPGLHNYDTIIVDEAHERSLNIDFILGYLKRLLPSRPDLRVLITSATIDTERFSAHFDGAPVIEVSGRVYPVDLRYQPMTEDAAGVDADGDPDDGGDTEAPDEVQAVCDAVGELYTEPPGDILVFLPGEREIRDTADALGKMNLDGLEILSLYGRLSSAEQHRIFERHAGRRTVLSTNVAETSLTVPGIRYVVDLGTARISRYSRRTKVQRLPIEPISKASANQRAGRCGRLGPGICVRLYSEQDFAARRPFTEPEILRTNLASVVLQMAAIGLGEIEDFPFVDPPDRRNVKDGIALLEELGALAPAEEATSAPRLTGLGRKLAQLPLDPRLGRMVLEAARLACLDEVLVITAGLSVQDPRERPAEKRDAAAALHARFAHESSDFMSYLKLWDYLAERQTELSSSQFRRLCRKELISYQRAREWQDVHAQLTEICRQLALEPRHEKQGRPAHGRQSQDGRAQDGRPQNREAQVHRALLSGLVTQVGAREGERADYSAPRGARFAIWPGSSLAKKSPRWVMAAELVETSRLWARVVAPVQPQWVEGAASHLLKWSYGEPAWDRARGAAVVAARATLYGLAVVPSRRVDLARLDPEQAREMFIRHALVEGDWDAAPTFVGENRDLLDRLRALLQRARRHDLMVGEQALFEFYNEQVGPDVTSSPGFNGWFRREGHAGLLAAPEDLWSASGADVDRLPDVWAGFPDVWAAGGAGALPLRYEWEPGAQDDGVSVEVPLSQLAKLAGEGLEWQVPGLREELVLALLRSLPKDLRRELVPVAEHARDFVAKAEPTDGPLLQVLAKEMGAVADAHISPGDFDWAKVPEYLRPTFAVLGEDGEVLARGKVVADLYRQLRPQMSGALQAAAARAPFTGRRSVSWDFGDLPKTFEPEWNGYRLRGYPALVDDGDAVTVRVFADPASQRAAMAVGARRLFLLNLPSRRALVDSLERQLDNRTKLALGGLSLPPYPSTREMAEDALAAAVDQVVADDGGPPWQAADFDALVTAVRQHVEPVARKGVVAAGRVISKLQELGRRAGELSARAAAPGSPITAALEDIAAQLAEIAGPRFVSRAGLGRLADVERYLVAVDRRLEKLPTDPRRDLALTQRAQALQQKLAEAEAVAGADRDALVEVGWMLQELRVSLFAQSLGTRTPVSEERISRAIEHALPAP
jgi:ATP-dependent helicase HrpA